MYGEESSDALRHGRRYSLHLPVRFRRTGENAWHVGTTENVSHSGVTIRARSAPPPSSPIDVVIALPATGLNSNGCLLGHGRVVRMATADVAASGPVFAVTVSRFRLEALGRAFETLAR
jgi:hypothetical protein